MKNSILLLAVLLAACGQSVPDMTPMDAAGNPKGAKAVSAPVVEDRFTVTRSMTFRDELAYGNMRGVYVIVDEKTGREYVGVSGIGIAESGSHNCGKACTKQDER